MYKKVNKRKEAVKVGYIGFAIIAAKIVVPMALVWIVTPKRLKNKFIERVNEI